MLLMVQSCRHKQVIREGGCAQKTEDGFCPMATWFARWHFLQMHSLLNLISSLCQRQYTITMVLLPIPNNACEDIFPC